MYLVKSKMYTDIYMNIPKYLNKHMVVLLLIDIFTIAIFNII